MDFNVALVGNPNSGKTTLFNRLTGSSQHVGNWAGVTVEIKSGDFRYEEHLINLIDLPGIYSLSTYSMEEIITRDYIMHSHPDLIMNIIDGSNLERNLYLSMQLKELGLPMVIAINMVDELAAKGINLDVEKLSELTGITCVAISAKKGEGLDELIHQLLHNAKIAINSYNKQLDTAIQNIRLVLSQNEYDETHNVFYAIKLLEEDPLVVEQFKLDEQQIQQIDKIKKELIADTIYDSCDMAIGDMRYNFIEKCLSESLTMPSIQKIDISEKIDSLLTHKYLGIIMFFVIIGLMFAITFGPIGEILSQLLEIPINGITTIIINFVTGLGATSVTIEFLSTILNAIASVLSLLPNIILLFLMLTILEDSGYMARGAFLMDAILRKIGLNGKAFIPMLMGFGCSVPSILSARIMDNENDRKMTILLVPFMSCTARLPIYTLFASLFFKGHEAIVIFLLYILGIVVAIICGWFLRKSVFKQYGSTFIMELPPYRLPSFKNVFLQLWIKTKDYIYKAGTIIFAMSVLFWFLTSFTLDFEITTDASKSILGVLGKNLEFLFIPLGFGSWEAIVSLFSGFIAKESIVSTFSIVYKTTSSSELSTILMNNYNWISAISFMVFSLLYVPCVATVSVIKKETQSWKFTLGSILLQTSIAYVTSLIIYNILYFLFG